MDATSVHVGGQDGNVFSLRAGANALGFLLFGRGYLPRRLREGEVLRQVMASPATMLTTTVEVTAPAEAITRGIAAVIWRSLKVMTCDIVGCAPVRRVV